MTKQERKYLRSAYHHFQDKYGKFHSMTPKEAALHLKDYEAFLDIVLHTLTMSSEDYMFDDQALYINIENKGLVIISGCAHAGIVNTIKYGQKIMGVDHIFAVVGGFHLKDANDERIKSTVNELITLNPEIIAPCHCTGSKAINQLLKAFKNNCYILKTGGSLKL